MPAPLGEDIIKVLFETEQFQGHVDNGIKSIAPLLISAGLGTFVPFVSPLIVAGLTGYVLPKALRFAGGKLEIAEEHLQQYEQEGGSKAALARVVSPCLSVLKKVIPAPDKELHQALTEDGTKLKDFFEAILKNDETKKEFENNLKQFLTGSSDFQEFQRNVKETMGLKVDRLSIEAYTQFTGILYNREILDRISAIGQISEENRRQIDSALNILHSDFERNFSVFQKEIKRLYEVFRQNYGLVRLRYDFFIDYKSGEDLEDWRKGFTFKLESIKANLEFRRAKLIESIKKKLDDSEPVLIVGTTGFSKTTIFYEIICDYYERGYEILYNEGSEIRNGPGLQDYIVELLKEGNKVLVAVDNAHTPNAAAAYFVVDRLLSLNDKLRKNLRILLTARLPELDTLIDYRLETLDEVYRDSVRKIARKGRDEDNMGFRFRLPAFEPNEIKEFYKFYNQKSDAVVAPEQEGNLNEISNSIFRETNGHPILVKFLALGHDLLKHVQDIYESHLKDDENKTKTMIACGLLDISLIPITDELLHRIGILTHAQDLESITLRHEDSPTGHVWKTFHVGWDIELLSFLFNENIKGTELKLRTQIFEDIIKSMFDNGDDQTISSIMTSVYHIAAAKRLPIEIVEPVISKHMSNPNLNNKARRDLYALVMPFADLVLQRFEKGIEKCEEAIKIDKDFSPAHLNKGGFLFRLRRYPEAIECYSEAIRINPNHSTDASYNKGKAFYRIACSYAKQSDIERSLDSLKQAIEINKIFRELAIDDGDFANIRDDDRFKALITNGK